MEQLGKFLGRYQLVRVLGRGAMGVVYEGADPKLNRKVAVKTILKSQMVGELAAEYSARFTREAQAVGRLNHPNVVTVFDFGSEAEVAYLVMEFISGKELKSYLDAKHVFGVGEAVAIVCDLLEALDYAHNNGIVHRDVKPANVMLDENGRVKLTDFGVARLTDVGQEGTRAGTMVGTPSYMSPEQIQGAPVGAQADLFACGVLLYQCLSLQKPFGGDSEWEIWQKIVHDAPPPLATYRMAIPAALERVILRALAKDPKGRPASARAMIDDLNAAIAGEVFDDEATRMVPGRDQTGPLGGTRGGSLARGQRGASDQTVEVELEFWRSIKDSGDPEEFKLFLDRFSSGTYADLARRKMAKLDGSISGVRAVDAPMSGRAPAAAEGQPVGTAEPARASAQPESDAEDATRVVAAQIRRAAPDAATDADEQSVARDMAAPAPVAAKGRVALWSGGALIALVLIGAGVALISGREGAGSPGPAAAPPAAPAPAQQASNPSPVVGASAASGAPEAPAPEAGAAQPPGQRAKGVAPAALRAAAGADPPSADGAQAKQVSAAQAPPAVPKPSATSSAAHAAQKARCNEILQRAVVGQPITPQEEANLRKECK